MTQPKPTSLSFLCRACGHEWNELFMLPMDIDDWCKQINTTICPACKAEVRLLLVGSPQKGREEAT